MLTRWADRNDHVGAVDEDRHIHIAHAGEAFVARCDDHEFSALAVDEQVANGAAGKDAVTVDVVVTEQALNWINDADIIDHRVADTGVRVSWVLVRLASVVAGGWCLRLA